MARPKKTGQVVTVEKNMALEGRGKEIPWMF